MNKLYKPESKATICKDKNCITVYGDAADIVTVAVTAAAVISAIALIAKAMR